MYLTLNIPDSQSHSEDFHQLHLALQLHHTPHSYESAANVMHDLHMYSMYIYLEVLQHSTTVYVCM